MFQFDHFCVLSKYKFLKFVLLVAIIKYGLCDQTVKYYGN